MNEKIQHSVQTSKLFSRFQKIPGNAFHDFFYFYQFYLQQINSLDFEEYTEIKFNYLQACFHLDKYPLFYKTSDELILELLNHHLFDERAKNIYEQILNLKAEAFFNENKMQTAQSLYAELLKLNPAKKEYKRKLIYLFIQREQLRNKKYIALVVLSILLSLLCTGIDIFISQTFFPQWSSFVILCRNVFFSLGILGFIIIQGAQLISAFKFMQRIKIANLIVK